MATIKFELSKKGGKDNDRPELQVLFSDGSPTTRYIRLRCRTGLYGFRDYWPKPTKTVPHPLQHNTKNINPLFLQEVIAVNENLSTLKTKIESKAADTPASEMTRAWLAAIVEDVLHPTKKEKATQKGPKTLISAVEDFVEASHTIFFIRRTASPTTKKTFPTSSILTLYFYNTIFIFTIFFWFIFNSTPIHI